jgi:hypothetical protein
VVRLRNGSRCANPDTRCVLGPRESKVHVAEPGGPKCLRGSRRRRWHDPSCRRCSMRTLATLSRFSTTTALLLTTACTGHSVTGGSRPPDVPGGDGGVDVEGGSDATLDATGTPPVTIGSAPDDAATDAVILTSNCAPMDARFCEQFEGGPCGGAECGGDGGDAGVCVDPMVDPLNCGSCGTVCSGALGSCAGGVCRRPPRIVASGQDRPLWIAVDATRVYWMNDDAVPNGTIMAVPISGGTPATLASASLPTPSIVPSAGHPGGLAVDSTGVYWTNVTDKVLMVPPDGGVAVTLATGQEDPHAVVLDPSNVYWANLHEVVKLPKHGGPPVTLVSGVTEVGTLEVDSSNIYWSDSAAPGSVNKVPIGGGPSTRLASTTDFAETIVLTSSSLCWNLGSGPCGNVACAPLGGCPAILGDLPGGYIAGDSNHIYAWTNHGELAAVDPAGGGSTILGSTPGGAYWMAVGATEVYWTQPGLSPRGTGLILALPK